MDYNDIIEYLKYFHRYFEIDITTDADMDILSFVNVVVPFGDIGISEMQNDGIINSDASNIIFTPHNDFTKIFSFEPWKEMAYIRMDKYYSKICMHILPKTFDVASNDLLLLKESEIDEDKISFSSSDEYSHDGRCTFYETGSSDDSFGEYIIELPENIKQMLNIDINTTYRYNSSSQNVKHSLGVKDNTNYAPEDRRALFYHEQDSLPDNENIAQLNESFEVDDPISELSGFDVSDHEKNTLYHSRLKYISDDLYIEQQGQSAYADWIDNIEGD